jgi:DNA-binding CsgD family transcriptional regulator
MARSTIERARDAAGRRAWQDAYASFAKVEASTLTAADLEAMADTAWWLSRFDESTQARQRAYAAYSGAGDDEGAARTAARVAIEHYVRQRPSIGMGFLLRAQRHAKRVPAGAGHGFLAMVEASVARFSGELDRAIELSEQALAIAEETGERNLMAMSLHVLGATLVDAGRIPEGIAAMDEAMVSVLSGELDPYFTGVIFCQLIGVCLELHDVRRAGEWSDAANRWCRSLGPDSMFPGQCAVNHAEVSRLRGAWPQAEAEAEAAADQLLAIDPALAGPAFIQLAEVRHRMGDTAGAEEAYLRGEELGADPQPGLALLRASLGRASDALAELRRAAATERTPARRARLLCAIAEVGAALGDVEAATAAADELDAIAHTAAVDAISALASLARGVCRGAGNDAAGACADLAAAAEGFEALSLPYEAARARIAYGKALLAAGEHAAAGAALRSAASTMERLGARRDLDEIEAALAGSAALPAGLTPREAEVLRLVAAGKTNRDIAVELVISEHTVGRHLQNMFTKLGVSSRSAATAFAFEHGLA